MKEIDDACRRLMQNGRDYWSGDVLPDAMMDARLLVKSKGGEMADDDDKWRFYEITHKNHGKAVVRASSLEAAYAKLPYHSQEQSKCSLSITVKDPQVGFKPILSY